MQNPIPKLRQTSIISKKPGFLSEKLKTLTSSIEFNTLEFNIFCWNFTHVFYLVMSIKGYVGFLKFCLDLELLMKECVEIRSFLIFANNSRSKQNK